jgi:serine/threonine-protein kinase RsbW
VRSKRDKHKRPSASHGKTSATPSDFLLKLELQSNPESLSLVRAAIERATESLHFQPAESRAVVRSVDEALANVMRHAYGGKPGYPIEVTCNRLRRTKKGSDPAGIEIVLRDSGAAVDPEKLHGRPLDEIRPGGLGLHFMKQSMDKVQFSRSQGQNKLRLVKYLVARKPDPGAQGD